MTEASDAQTMLAELDLFRGLSTRHVKRLLGLAQEVDFRPGHEIAAEGLGALAFHLVLSGEAAVTQDGQELGRLGRGDYFGEISMIDGKPRSATVVAVQPVRTLAISRHDFLGLLDREPEFARELLEGLCRRLRAAEDRQRS
jgi:CRP-like cAMP-binding protein